MVGTVTSKGSAAARGGRFELRGPGGPQGLSLRAAPRPQGFPYSLTAHTSVRGDCLEPMVFWGKLSASPRESPRAPGENGKLALHFRAGDQDFVRVRLGSGLKQGGGRLREWVLASGGATQLLSLCGPMNCSLC